MGKSTETFNKKEKEKKRLAAKKEKAEKMQQRKANASKGQDLQDMMAYIDEYGNLSSKPPDPQKKQFFKADDIIIGSNRQGVTNVDEKVRKGIVINFNEDKGYGFIRDIVTNESLFVHAKSLEEPVKGNSKVTFEIGKSEKGRMAISVKRRI
jgi:cold shock CspA family protein